VENTGVFFILHKLCAAAIGKIEKRTANL